MSQWISEKQKPEVDKPVLAWWRADKIEGAAWSGDVWYYLQDGDTPLDNPLFWMPLPEPPKPVTPAET